MITSVHNKSMVLEGNISECKGFLTEKSRPRKRQEVGTDVYSLSYESDAAPEFDDQRQLSINSEEAMEIRQQLENRSKANHVHTSATVPTAPTKAKAIEITDTHKSPITLTPTISPNKPVSKPLAIQEYIKIMKTWSGNEKDDDDIFNTMNSSEDSLFSHSNDRKRDPKRIDSKVSKIVSESVRQLSQKSDRLSDIPEDDIKSANRSQKSKHKNSKLIKSPMEESDSEELLSESESESESENESEDEDSVEVSSETPQVKNPKKAGKTKTVPKRTVAKKAAAKKAPAQKKR